MININTLQVIKEHLNAKLELAYLNTKLEDIKDDAGNYFGYVQNICNRVLLLNQYVIELEILFNNCGVSCKDFIYYVNNEIVYEISKKDLDRHNLGGNVITKEDINKFINKLFKD